MTVYLRLLAVAALLAVAGCTTTATVRSATARVAQDAAATAGPTRASILHPPGAYWGLTLPGVPTGAAHSTDRLAPIARELGKPATIINYFQSWKGRFDPQAAANVWRAGALPMLSWQPYDPQDLDGNHPAYYQPDWTLSQILSGRYDGYIRQTADAIGALGFPLALRLAHEANGSWYPWGIHTRHAHNTPKKFVAMWRHVWHIFHAEGVHNVIWTWSVNALSARSKDSFRALYPGPKYVDWVGVSGYLLRTPSFDAAYGRTVPQLLKAAPHKPWLVTETAVGKTSMRKGVDSLFRAVRDSKRCIGVVWFDEKAARADWRFDGRRKVIRAIRDDLAGHRFLRRLPRSSGR